MELWYSPQFILGAADMAIEHCEQHGIDPPGNLGKAIGEGRPAAILALSLGQVLEVDMWLRMVDPGLGAPDVEMMYVDQVGRSNRLNVLPVEVATYERHAIEDLAPFIMRTKLSNPKKAYPKDTVFLFFVNRNMEPEVLRSVHGQLRGEDSPALVFVVGRVGDDLFQVAKVYPTFGGPDNVSLAKAMESAQDPVLEAKRGMSSIQTPSAQLIATENPFLKYINRRSR